MAASTAKMGFRWRIGNGKNIKFWEDNWLGSSSLAIQYCEIDDDDLWLILGDFNFYGSTENRNRPGGNYNDILVFNSIISHLGLIELPIKGRSFTWSNMQGSPRLEQIDWFFTSVAWTTRYPSTLVLPLARIISDHLPCKVQIGTAIPKANNFQVFLGRIRK